MHEFSGICLRIVEHSKITISSPEFFFKIGIFINVKKVDIDSEKLIN